jgi:hypothetical protein
MFIARATSLNVEPESSMRDRINRARNSITACWYWWNASSAARRVSGPPAANMTSKIESTGEPLSRCRRNSVRSSIDRARAIAARWPPSSACWMAWRSQSALLDSRPPGEAGWPALSYGNGWRPSRPRQDGPAWSSFCRSSAGTSSIRVGQIPPSHLQPVLDANATLRSELTAQCRGWRWTLLRMVPRTKLVS